MQRNVSTWSQQTVSYLRMRGYVVKTEKIPTTQTTNKVSCSVSRDSSVLNTRFSPTPHGAMTQEKENTELNWLKTYSWLITAKHNWLMNPAGGGKFQELETCASTSLLRVWRSKRDCGHSGGENLYCQKRREGGNLHFKWLSKRIHFSAQNIPSTFSRLT